MGQYSKSKKVIQRAWEKFKDSFRWNTGNLRIYELNPDINSVIGQMKAEISNSILDLPLEFSQLHIKDASLSSAEVLEENTAFEPVITAETPPDQIEVEIHEESLENVDTEIQDHSLENMDTEAKSLNPAFSETSSAKGLSISKLSTEVKRLYYNELEVQVKDGDKVLAEVPIIRNSMDIFKMHASARMAYWKEIVDQTGKRPKELDLLGIFAHVPIKGITKASIDQTTGILRLWYAPEQRKNKSATLLIAKDRATNKMVQVFDRRTVE